MEQRRGEGTRAGPVITSERNGPWGVPKVATVNGGRVMNMTRREAFFVVGHLDHTFALRRAHSRFRVAGPSRSRQPSLT